MLMTDWNPTLYSKFEAERMRAARDLLARIPLERASLVYDLGCGPGNSAELLLRRFPDSRIVGLDTSDAMLAHARVRAPQATFVKQDIADWAPEDKPDLIFANAALQFLPDHDRLFPRLISYLAPGGALAAQMPNIARESSHALMRMVAAEGPWSTRLVPIAKTQPLIADWFAGSTLQPFLERLGDEERCEFLARYRAGLKDAYPAQPDGRTLFAYPRLFIVAVKAAA